MSNQVASNRLPQDSRYNGRVTNYFKMDPAFPLGRQLPIVPTPPTKPYGWYWDSCNDILQPTNSSQTAIVGYAGAIKSTLADIVPYSIYNTEIAHRITYFRVQTAGFYSIEGCAILGYIFGLVRYTVMWGVYVDGEAPMYGAASTENENLSDARRTVCRISCRKYFKVGDVFTVAPSEQDTYGMHVIPQNPTAGSGITYLSIIKL